ncbi:MAG: ABC transporter ATP-binding protein [Gammaproteobacteria bacterium]|nr:ABC transporter ATP-binding protein [Gammaproteobacteria bacterium]
MSKPDEVLEVRDLVKRYPAVLAVDGVNFSVRRGSCFGLLGPNGAGKTTTVEMMEGIMPPTSGEILYEGHAIGPRFRDEVGIQFQSTALQDHLTVLETLQLFRRLYKHGADLEQVIQMCSLEKLLKRDNRKLSGGQRQRLLLGVALVNDPKILFLDEPTTGLDPQARRNFWELVERIKENDKTVILTTHYMEEAYRLCDEIAIMDQGKIIAQGSPQALLKEHFDDVILELPKSDLPSPLVDFAFPVLERGDYIEISTPDVNLALAMLVERNINLNRMQVRPRNLEDLFLELTGEDLRT